MILAHVQSMRGPSAGRQGQRVSSPPSAPAVEPLKLAGGFSFSMDLAPLFLTVHVFADLRCLFSFCVHS